MFSLDWAQIKIILKIGGLSLIGSGLFVFFYLSFKGLVAVPSDFYIFNLRLHFYSIFLTLGVLGGYLISREMIIGRGMDVDLFDKAILVLLLAGFAGARLFFVWGNWQNYFSGHPADIIKIWQGGLAFYGGILGGA